MADTPAPAPRIPVSWGELADKITILEIKSEKLGTAAALRHVRHELALLREIAAATLAEPALAALGEALKQVNAALWDTEDRIRAKEKAQRFDDEFIALARAVYRLNDRRAALKRAINEKLASDIREEKSYEDY